MKYPVILLFVLILVGSLSAFTPDFGNMYGDSYLMRVDGVYSLTTNPSMLAQQHTYASDMEILNFGFGIRNNGLDITTLNNYAGKHLTQKDKNDFLDSFGSSLVLSGNTDVTLLALGFQSWGLHIGGHAMFSGQVDKDYLKLALNGNTYGKTYHFTKSQNDACAVGYADVTFAGLLRPLDRYLSPLQEYNIPQIHLGYSVSYLQPIIGYRVADYNGKFATSDISGMEVDQSIRMKEGHAGYGFKGMLSATADVNEHLSVGLSLDNLFGFLKFTGNNKDRYLLLNSDSLYIANLDEDMFSDTTFTKDAGDFSIRLPLVTRLGAIYRWTNWNISADYIQHFESSVNSSTVPMLALCGEWCGVHWLPLRLAFTTGNELQPMAFTWSGGLHFRHLTFDVGYRCDGSILPLWYAKGGGLTLSTRYIF